ncbi:hypothetical protein GOP47_0017640 [Adiantum capillus-veneris]|uniref:Mannosyltransferase n=1 Tax=Adiantum capillus-veneris TaxID=13818 RepID=A0A9D4UG67_ADICA|nr:hypothetical protein GOP47_0017640 [Adiantum capillus-veneris]
MRRRVPTQHVEEDRISADRKRSGAPKRENPWSESKLLLCCISFRLLNALVLQTFFNPDEYWQSVEVAHRIVFGYGHLTWEWSKGIRSYVHPLIFAGLYKVLKFTKMDTRWLVMKAPRLLQGLFAAAGDLYLFRLARLYWGDHTAKWAIFCQLCNWFNFFCMVRTFSNCLETVLTLAALYHWVVGERSLKSNCFSLFTARQLALFLAALACVIRPTSAIVWMYVGLIGLIKTDKKSQLLFEVIVIGVFTFGASCLADRWMYGKWILVPLNFLRFNFFASGGNYYGTHPWHWYFSQGFPAIIMTFLPLSILGIWWSKQWQLAGLMGWVLSLYSCLGHKEFRFVLPVLPIGLMFAGYALARMQYCVEEQCFDSGSTLHEASKTKTDGNMFNFSKGKMRSWGHACIIGLLITNIPTALYTSLVHQRGTETVMHVLSEEIVRGDATNIVYLMPCHSTPYYSFLHSNVTLRFLDCTPSNEEGYVDESDRFLAEPALFLDTFLRNEVQLPSHFVLYDSVEKRLLPFFKEYGYQQVRRIFHAHLPVDHGLINHVIVYRLGEGR